jgi:endonuclease/exonuclease/phosphatase family metal-dependent hydrolase
MKIYKGSTIKYPNMTIIIMGDLNAKIGKGVYEHVVKHTLHETTNSNGEWFCE